MQEDQQNALQKKSGKSVAEMIIPYISEVITIILILVYAALSPSLFSAIALLFLMLAIAANISKIYYVNNVAGISTIAMVRGKNLRVRTYPLERVIWIMFTLVHFGTILFKTIVYVVGLSGEFTEHEQQFYEVQSLEYLYIPIIVIPFAIGSVFIPPDQKTLGSFTKQIPDKLKTPCYLLLSILIVMIQVLSPSLIGMGYFFVIIALFFLQDITFGNQLYQFFVFLIQLVNLLIIPFSLLAITPYFQSFGVSLYYPMIGIEGLSEFMTNPRSRGHFIAEILIFLYCCVLQRMFSYQKITSIALDKIDNISLSESKIFGENMTTKSKEFSPSKLLRESLLKLKKSYQNMNNENQGKQFEMTSSRRDIYMGNNDDSENEQLRASDRKRAKTFKEFQKGKKQYSNSIKIRSASTFSKKSVKGESSFTKYWNTFLKAINKVAEFLNSSEFTLRVVEVISIVVIQRYNNVYSFIALLWLALVASVENLKVVLFATAIILLPLEIGNYFIIFLYNTPQTFFSDMGAYEIWGFQVMERFWLDIIIFNIYLYYIILFVCAASQETRTSTYTKSKKVPEPSNFVLVVAFFFRYTYLFTISGMFFMGFSNVTAMDLVYVLLFFMFFTFGENVTTQEKKKKRKSKNPGQPDKIETKFILTTLSRKFWFVIVYYTLGCIVCKYIYFLFFAGKSSEIVGPIGLNQEYNWLYSFALSSTCRSNTTPYFVIFLLAEIQILIYRSNIYLNYSFSLLASSKDRNLKDDRKKKVELTKSQTLIRLCKKVLLFSLQLYYQSLYIISGVIILACTYRWNIIQVPIVIITCYGLIRKFSKTVLASIVLLDLFYIFTNYCFRFINYPVIQQMFGTSFSDIWRKFALFCGFILDPSMQLHTIFAFNVVIYYFSVESYRLCNLLSEKKFIEAENRNKYERESRMPLRAKNKDQDLLSEYNTTVIDSEYEDQQFATNYQHGMVEATKKYYNTNLMKKYPWLRYICKLLAIIIIDIVAIVVLVCCLFFRLSFSMLLFLTVYLVFYYVLFDRIGNILTEEKYMRTVQAELDHYNRIENQLQDRINPEKILHYGERLNNLKDYLDRIYWKIIEEKCICKKKMWIFSVLLSVSCMVLTYAAQFFVSEFYSTYINLDNTDMIENILFIAGFSVNNQNSFFRQVYFYYFMVVINVLEKLLIRFMEIDNELKVTYDIKKDFKMINSLQNPSYFLDKHLYTQDFVENSEIIHEPLKILEDDEINSEDSGELDDDDKEKQVVSTSNVLIFFNYREVQIQTNLLYGLLSAMVRIYLWLMLINVYEKSNISAFLYLIAVFYFWFRRIEFSIVKDINKAAIFILLFQYIMLLLDIDSTTSPLPLPNQLTELSFLRRYITNVEWLQFLVISKGSDLSGVAFVSFLINSIIIFVTEVYFAGIQWVSRKCILLIENVWDRYQYIHRTISAMDHHQKLDLNYENYKSLQYRISTFIYENSINNSYIFVSMLVLFLLSGNHNYVSLGLLIFAFIYIYASMFTSFGSDEKIFKYTEFYFRIFRLIMFLILTISLILDIPPIQNYLVNLPTIVGLEIDLSEIFLILALQLWLDLTKSEEFYRVTVTNISYMRKRQSVRLKCLAYQSNNYLVRSLIDTYNYILTFDINIEEAKVIIKEWDENFKVQDGGENSSEQEIDQKLSLTDTQTNVRELSPSVLNLHKKIKEIQKQEQEQEEQESDEMHIKQSIMKVLERYNNHSLSYTYFQMMQYIVRNNKKVLRKVLNKEKISIDIWDYIMEDYTKLQEQIVKSSDQLNHIGMRVNEEEEDFRLDLIKIIKEEEYDLTKKWQNRDTEKGWGKSWSGGELMEEKEKEKDLDLENKVGIDSESQAMGIQEELYQIQQELYNVTTPSKINLIIKSSKSSLSQTIWYWFLSNFNYFLSFMVWIYYVLNPALLSLPLIVYLFSYEIIADRKYTNLMLIYLFIVIVLGEMFQLELFNESTWTKYFFYLPEYGTYHFFLAYLFFLFVLIFINEEIKKYQGIKEHHECEAENLETSALRVLINQEEDSNMNLWKMLVENELDYEKSCNPIHYFATKIEESPQKLIEKTEPSFTQSFYRNKIGIDLYPYIAVVQISLLIFMIFLYPVMTLVNKSALEQTYKYFSFSSNMILAVLSHIFVIVVERKITLLTSENPHKQLIKYIFTQIVFLLFLIYIYYWASELKPSSYQPQPALIAFSFFYFIYFFLSGLQVKFGFKKFKKINSFMVKRDNLNYYFMMVFIAIPFLYEIKCIMDWTFLKTSIQLFDWFKLFSIYVGSFSAKMQYKGSIGSELGEPIGWTVKLIGWIGFTVMLLIIFGPMILFSGLNPSAQQNLVIGGSLKIGIQIVGGNQFTLYSTSHFSTPPISFNRSYFVEKGLDNVPDFQGLTESELERQVQQITFQKYSDTFWGISAPNYHFLKTNFNQTSYQMKNNITPAYQYQIKVEYLLDRQVSAVTGASIGFLYPTNKGSLNVSLVESLNDTLHTCNKSTTLPGLYQSLVRLTTSGTTYKPTPLIYVNDEDLQPYLQNVTITMICDDDGTTVNDSNIDTNNIYWEIQLENSKNGAQMFVYCDLYQSLLGGLSFTAIYTSIILVVAGFVRGLLAGNLTTIPFLMNPKPDKILQICEAIGTLRDRKQYKDEFLMYYELIDVIRSPEVIRKLGASYAKQIEREYKQRKLREKLREQKERKKNL